MENLKRTPLYDAHVAAGAKMVPFAGWEMPIEYTGLVDEHTAVREAAGLFDVSHMGEVEVKGADAFNFVQYLVSNDVSTLEDNQILYTHMCYEDGGTVDDLLVYRFDSEFFYLVINASNIDKDVAWIKEVAAKYDVEITNVSDDVAEVAIQGPNAQTILQLVSDVDLTEIKFFYCNREVKIAGKTCLVSRTGYTGEDGFEVYAKPEDITEIWNALMEAGKEHGLKPAALGCRDTLRFEVALPLYGNELSSEISPLEGGLGFFVKLDAGDFMGRDALVKQKEEGLTKKIIGFEMTEKGIPRQGYEVLVAGEIVGTVTTGYLSPSTGRTVGLALVKNGVTEMGSEIEIQIRKKTKKATVVAKRFYKKSYKK
ncbi:MULTISPECIES: glycine cleavage system aminomethyltransferase GcvT [unclassified Fusibacter]|uniref:glycine cleavage system aminomethyltransferase GcvT n=1 Tax=unclassified Fusibacter TaxID=2624464 RepID=UPI001011D2A9|nr:MULTISPECIES: glycine cleavage system aminomethyltransferase GcvT [unclassified Fusibacter]MCK8059639.1 glycine cleavage system aminomethyltransferase GcvT [Fusibacter sp. A2]NPE21440.1 glycine cleavage system aminomethyltransferase GcvT [Fusibacter sp. A1]RXV61852.1 glycine cleavage system aminomethyltransferase GcvT [Fusibacter sp. A1]